MKRIISKHHSMCKVVIEIPLFSKKGIPLQHTSGKTDTYNSMWLFTLNGFHILSYFAICCITKGNVANSNLCKCLHQNLIDTIMRQKVSLWKAVCCCEALYKYKMCAPLKRQRVAHCALGRVMPIAFEPRACRQLRLFKWLLGKASDESNPSWLEP